MRNPQLPGDVTRPNTVVRQLHYSLPYNVRQRPAVHKHATQLVHTTMALKNKTLISITACQTSRLDAIFEGITRNSNIHTAVHTRQSGTPHILTHVTIHTRHLQGDFYDLTTSSVGWYMFLWWRFLLIERCRIFIKWCLTLILLMRRIGWAPNNAWKWQIGFNS